MASSFDDTLRSQILAASTPIFMNNKHDIIEYFKDQYPGKEGRTEAWKVRATEFISGSTDHKSKEYKSAARNFQERGGRREMADKATAKWTDIGKKLPPISIQTPGKGITITVKGTQQRGGYRGATRRRTYVIELNGSEAYEFANGGDVTLKRLGRDFYGFDFEEDSGGEDGDTSSGETDVSSVSVS